MRSVAFVFVLLALIAVAAAKPADVLVRGVLSSTNVQTEVQGTFNVAGAGEVQIAYWMGSNTLAWYSSHSISSLYSPFQNLVLSFPNIADVASVTLAADASSPSYGFQELSFSSKDAENAFVDALSNAEGVVSFSTTWYPNGIALAYLNNYVKFGTKRIVFVADFPGDDQVFETNSKGSANIQYDRDEGIFDFKFRFNWKETDTDNHKVAVTVNSIQILSTIDGSVIYNFGDLKSNNQISESFEGNIYAFTLFNYGNAEIIVATNVNEQHFRAPITAVANN